MVESYLYCPFQFYLNYVLKVRPSVDIGEFDADHTRTGTRLHESLESLHLSLRDTTDGSKEAIIDRLPILVDYAMRAEIDSDDGAGTSLSQAIREIDSERIAAMLEQYQNQLTTYFEGTGKSSRPAYFEIKFGPSLDDGPPNPLSWGEGHEHVKLQGKIDRVDLIFEESGPKFRVIDYKSAGVPAGKDVLGHLTVQLPLYALAIENLNLLGDEPHEFGDFGYWGLAKQGFKPIRFPKGATWRTLKAGLLEAVSKAVARLRSADFSITPRKLDCTSRCDYSSTCRIREVRHAGKILEIVEIGALAEADRPDVQARD